jgi:hypothetical protein
MVSATKTDESADSTYVDVNHEEPLVYWTKRLQVSPLLLRQTVRIVGPRFKDVLAFLSQRQKF